MKLYFRPRGFTLVELVVTLGIVMIFLGFITISLTNIQKNASFNTSVDALISDLKSQQLKAMVGDTEGRGTPDSYGIYLNTSSYTLFHGLTYNPTDPSNFTITLEPRFTFADHGKSIVFLRLTGEVGSYSATENTIVLLETTTNDAQTIEYNIYGAVAEVN